MHMAVHTPCSPIVGASIAERVILTPHMLAKLMPHGISVSPAPTNTPYDTMAMAKKGSAKASILNAAAPCAMISGTGVSMPIISGANI